MGPNVFLAISTQNCINSHIVHATFKSLLTTPSNVLPLYLKQTFLPIICIFNEVEGDVIELRLPFQIFSTLHTAKRIQDRSIVFLKYT